MIHCLYESRFNWSFLFPGAIQNNYTSFYNVHSMRIFGNFIIWRLNFQTDVDNNLANRRCATCSHFDTRFLYFIPGIQMTGSIPWKPVIPAHFTHLTYYSIRTVSVPKSVTTVWRQVKIDTSHYIFHGGSNFSLAIPPPYFDTIVSGIYNSAFIISHMALGWRHH